MSKSRIKNSSINILVGIINQVLVLLLNFLLRTIFIKFIGVEYLGINGLFSQILSVLSIAELGVSSAIVYSMYKPIVDNNTEKIIGLINYYKKLYNRIALYVAIIGLSLVPFLKYIINLENNIDNITLYYLLFLSNSIVSYLFVYKTSIIVADQREYKLKIYNIVFTSLRSILQILVIMITKNYVLYILVQIICSLCSNLFSSFKSQKLYPYIKGNQQLDKEEKNKIWFNIKSLFMYKIGGVILNNTDNILISVLVGTVWVGFYSNYNMIISAIAGFTGIVFTSLQASIGNFNVDSTPKQKHLIFNVLNMISFWIYGFCVICLSILLQDFIQLWLGRNFVLDNSIVYISIFNFYLQGVLYPIWCFRHTSGLFKQTKYIMIFASIINLILSILFGHKFGLIGILIATAIARLLTNMWYEPVILFKNYFNTSPKKYFLTQILYGVLLVFIIIVIKFIIGYININNLFLRLICNAVVCTTISNCIFWIFFRKSKEFNYIYEKCILKLIRRN